MKNAKVFATLTTFVSLLIFSAGVVSAMNTVPPNRSFLPEFHTRPSFSPRPLFLLHPSDFPRPSFSPRPVSSISPDYCQKVIVNVQTRSANLIKSAGEAASKFNSIFLSVENFYTSKVVPSGKVVTNHQSLTADVNTKAQSVQSALDVVKSDAAGFTCTGADFKTQVMKFNEDMMSVRKALENYRLSIKNLIEAVHKVAGTVDFWSPRPLFSPRPRQSPGPVVNPL